MNIAGHFDKVCFEQFKPAYDEFVVQLDKMGKLNNPEFPADALFNDITEKKMSAESIYEGIRLPARATAGSAGYDIYTPFEFNLEPDETIKIPTGIRVKISEGWFLAIFPRSGLGFKYSLMLNNTVGIIDSDYYGSSNEGHIFVKLTNCNHEKRTVYLNQNDAFCQGIFLPFGITDDDRCNGIRNGGLGSTST